MSQLTSDDLENYLKVSVNATALGLVTPADKEAFDARVEGHNADLDLFWILTCAILVFWMQCGFGMIEAGSVRAKNVSNILFKNLLDGAMGSIGFWAIGYGLAYGVGDAGPNGFIGTGNFVLSQFNDEGAAGYVGFFWQLVFAATSATIISGSVAERCNINAYFIYSSVVSSFIYPVVAHWVWSTQGWISAFKPEERFPCGDDSCNGMIDFAGSGVVHLVGGTAALVAAWFIGPRHGKFTLDSQGNIIANPIAGHSQVLVCLGTLILWMGWYGFNCGSTLCMAGCAGLAGKVAINTTLAACMGGCIVCFMTKAGSHWDVPATCNGILAGLVGVTAGCATVEPWGAICIGFIAGFVYMIASVVVERCMRIDDPLCAFPIHGCCGAWGVLAAGIFSSTDGIAYAYGYENDEFKTGRQFLVQLAGLGAIVGWTLGTTIILFLFLKQIMDLRVPLHHEKTGLDLGEHGGPGYRMDEQLEDEQGPEEN